MKVIIVGFGAIGQRHYKLLKERGCDVCVVSKQKDLDILSFESLEEALVSYSPDVVFICNETVKHVESLMTCLNFSKDLKIIVEKPISSQLEPALLEMSEHNQRRIYVSYNLRLSPLLIRLKEEIATQNVLDVIINVGQDLSQWRKGNCKESYSAHKSKGGGVLRDLSHELDYILWIFGSVFKSVANVEKCSSLTVDSEDLVHALLKTERCPTVFLRLSYLDKEPIRIIRVNTDHATYELNFVKGYLSCNGKFLLENHYIADTYPIQADKIVNHDYNGFCTFSESIDVMKLILRIEANP